jgi:hypothetical protein
MQLAPLHSGVETPGADGVVRDEDGNVVDVEEEAEAAVPTTTKAPPVRTIGEHVPGVGRREVDVSELRERLGGAVQVELRPIA